MVYRHAAQRQWEKLTRGKRNRQDHRTSFVKLSKHSCHSCVYANSPICLHKEALKAPPKWKKLSFANEAFL